MAGGRNSNKNKKKGKSGGNTRYQSEEQGRSQEKQAGTVEIETANQSGSSGLKCENKKNDQIRKPKPMEVTGKKENKTVETNCHDSATENSQIKPLENEIEPIEKETANQSESSGLKCYNKSKDQIEKPKPIEVTGKVENKTVDTSCNDSATENSQVKPLENEIEPIEKETANQSESSGLQCDTKEKDQIEKPKPIVVTGKVENKTVDTSCNDSAIEKSQVKPLEDEIEPPQEDGKDKCIQNSLRDQNIAYLRELFRPLIIKTLLNIILSSLRNAKGLEKETSQRVVDESNNIEEMSEQLQNKQEPNDQTQKEIKATEGLENTKEPNDQCQYKQVPTEQLPNEKETFDKLQNPKEKDVQNIILSSPQNTHGLEKEALQSIADESNGIRELNDQLEEPKEIHSIKFWKPPKGEKIEYKQALQCYIQCVVPELKQLLQEKFSHRRLSSDGLKSETETSSVEDSQIKLNELDVHSLLNRDSGINMETTDTPNFESTRIEEPDEVKEQDDASSINVRNPLEEIIMVGISNFNRNRKKRQSVGKAKYESEEQKSGQENEKETVVEQRNREQQPFIEEELKEEVKENYQLVETNDSVVKTNGSLDHVTTFGTTDGAEIKPLQEPLRFHAVHGNNICLSKNDFRAQRKKKSNFFSKGIAFSSRPVAVGEKVSFHLKQLSSYWLGLITIGFTTNDPISIADNLPTNVITDRDCADGFWAEHLDKKYYQESCRVHYYLNSSGNMCFGVNGVDKIEFLWNLETTKPVWALIDVFGYFTVVEFDIPKEVTQEISNTSFIESSLLSDRNGSGNSFKCSLDDNERNEPNLNYQTRYVPLDLYRQVEGICMKFLEDQGICVSSGDKVGCIDVKLPLFPGQTIVVQNLSVGKARFHIGVKYGSPKTEASSELPAPVYTKVIMQMKDELAITFTEAGEIRVTKNLDVPKTILKVNRYLELWPFVEIFKRNQMIKMWSSNTPSPAASQT